MARVLVMFRHGPHGRAHAREGLDLALAAVAFEHAVSVYFCGAGVGLLRTGQDTAAAELKDFCRAFRALPLHGLQRAGVAAEALREYGLSGDALALDVSVLDPAQAALWLEEADVVFSF